MRNIVLSKKHIVWMVFIFILFLLVSLPSFFSSTVGQKQLVKLISYAIDGPVTLHNAKFSWIRKQEIQELTFKSPSQAIEGSIQSIQCSQGLLFLLLNLGDRALVVENSEFVFGKAIKPTTKKSSSLCP